jgi:hypothetical protein
MTDSQQQKAEDKRTDGKGHCQQNRRHRPMQEPKKKDPDGVPILRYGPNNNFMRFQEALSKKALEEYGMLGKRKKIQWSLIRQTSI